jgi:hypothetical protein
VNSRWRGPSSQRAKSDVGRRNTKTRRPSGSPEQAQHKQARGPRTPAAAGKRAAHKSAGARAGRDMPERECQCQRQWRQCGDSHVSKKRMVPLKPSPPNQPNIFWARWAKKTMPSRRRGTARANSFFVRNMLILSSFPGYWTGVPAGLGIGSPSGTGWPKSGVPSGFHLNNWARGER